MRGKFHISEGHLPGKPHQPDGSIAVVDFDEFPELQVGDQFGFQTQDRKVQGFGLIVHARTFSGVRDGREEWGIHCHVYTMNSGSPAIQPEVFEELERYKKLVVPQLEASPLEQLAKA